MAYLFYRWYDNVVLKHPVVLLTLLVLIFSFFAYHTRDFKLDASADSLILEDDRDLKIFREVSERYDIQEFLVVTFTPDGDLFSRTTLQQLGRLRDSLKELERVDSVTTILDIPLLKTSGLSLTELADSTLPTIEDPGIDLSKAQQELTTSPIYEDLVVSSDGRTTALIANLKNDTAFSELLKKRNALSSKKRNRGLTPEEEHLLHRYAEQYEVRQAVFNKQRHEDIRAVRSVIKPFNAYGTVYLGGVPMIADDMISFIKNDLIVFGFGVFIFIVITLSVIFREVRWVVLPLICCFFSVIVMIGTLGFLNWKVTVISSNFISLMLITTISMNIHLAVRYRQFCRDMPSQPHKDMLAETIRKMFWPCLYTALTTILAFSSLVFSGIRPVIDFGWMMTIGLTVTFFTSFVLFPAIVVLMKKSEAGEEKTKPSVVTKLLALAAQFHGGKIALAALCLAVLSAFGISRLKVENSFIDYFSKKTEIYKGMKLIDDTLGGTAPLDILISFDKNDAPAGEQKTEREAPAPDTDFDDFDWLEEEDNPEDYWLTPYKIDMIKQVHDYVAALKGVGKVLSLASVVRVVEQLNKGNEFDGIDIGVLYKKIPDDIKATMVDPYISIEHNEARISLRVLDSLKGLRRKVLLEDIKTGLYKRFGLGDDRVTVTGLLVLYNNMLQSLFRSQILTLGIVLLGIGLMLLVLFRSFSVAVIGIIPNLFAVGLVLGIMGLLRIPLDMMTITIAAITMGIAIDNSIHYMYRFREELPANGDYSQTMHICHRTVGRAILNTSLTIIFGFSILVLSNFLPTIYFGIFTGLAMFIAMLSVLTLLPKLIMAWKPF